MTRKLATVRDYLELTQGKACGRLCASELYAKASAGLRDGEVPAIVFDTPAGRWAAIRPAPASSVRKVVRWTG